MFPTDTVFGLGSSPFDRAAVVRVVRAKQREKPALPVLCQNIGIAARLVELTDPGRRLAMRYWPGPLTLVGRLRDTRIVPEVRGYGMTLAVRVPAHPCTLALLALVRGALVGTSANLSGRPPAVTAEQAVAVLGDVVDAIVVGGPAPVGQESTVVDVTKWPPRILRVGVIPASAVADD